MLEFTLQSIVAIAAALLCFALFTGMYESIHVWISGFKIEVVEQKRKAHDHDYQEYTDAELGLERLADGEVVEHIPGDTKIPKQNVMGSSPITR